MNGKYPLETRSAVLCLVKGEAEIQVKKKLFNIIKSISFNTQAKAQARDSSTMPCTNSNSHVLKVHAPGFFPIPHKEDTLREIIHFEIKRLCLEKKSDSRIPSDSSSLLAFEIRHEFY